MSVLWLGLLFGCQGEAIQASIEPSEPLASDSLRISLVPSEAELLSVRWLRDGEEVSRQKRLPVELTAKGERWTAEVAALLPSSSDGAVSTGQAENLTAPSVVIANSPPIVLSIWTEPESPIAGEEVLCQATAVDPDGDGTEVGYSWAIGDEVFARPLLSGEEASEGLWVCTATPSDGEAEGPPASLEVSLGLPEAPPTEEPDTNLVVNGGFETGDLEGWSASDDCTIVAGLSWLVPYAGDWMLFGGEDATGDCILEQDIDLLAIGHSASELDGSGLQFWFSGALANSGDEFEFDDHASLQIDFLDTDGEVLSQVESLVAGQGDWLIREGQRLLPVGVRTLRFRLRGELRTMDGNMSHFDDLQAGLSEAGPADPVLQKPPMLQDYRQDTMRILWETDGVGHHPFVEWGQSDLLQRQEAVRSIWIDDSHVVHIAELTGLEPGSSYRYRVGGGEMVSEEGSFTTAPLEDHAPRIAWLADNQEGATRFATHVEHIDEKDPDMLFVAGDVVQTGGVLEEWDELWWSPLQESDFARDTPVLIARGNHDKEYPYAYAYTSLPGNGAWYSFRYGSVFVLVLDSQTQIGPPGDSLSQGRFIEEALSSEEALSAAFQIAVFHQAPFTNSVQHETTGNENVREHWVPLFAQHGVDLVVSGHFHSYQRGELDGITYVIVGGGGSNLLGEVSDFWDFMDVQLTWNYAVMDIVDEELVWTAYDLDDGIIDSFSLEGR
jgi:3',5'-cyclic AMP phosphodiesterase CpdA